MGEVCARMKLTRCHPANNAGSPGRSLTNNSHIDLINGARDGSRLSFIADAARGSDRLAP